MNEFDQLLAEIKTQADMAKSMTVKNDPDTTAATAKENQRVEAAAAAGVAASDPAPGEPKDDELFGKSMTVKDAEGNEIEAYDATAALERVYAAVKGVRADLIKSMQAGLVASGNQNGKVGELIAELGAQRALVAEQGDLIKSLQAEIKQIGEQGTGRRSAASLVVHEKTAPAAPAAPTIPEVMGWVQKAMSAGAITGTEAVITESRLKSNVLIDADVMARIEPFRTKSA